MLNKFPESIDLKKIPLFSYFSDEELNEIRKGLKLETLKRGDAIFSSGDSADRMFIVYEGFMKISMYLSDGREQILYIYKKDDFVGGFNIPVSYTHLDVYKRQVYAYRCGDGLWQKRCKMHFLKHKYFINHKNCQN